MPTLTFKATTTTVDLDALGRIGTALADETRRQLLVALLSGPGYPAELAEALGLTKANVSNHLACLRGCGLVVTTPEGRRVRYELADRRFVVALRQLVDLALPPADGCAHDRRNG
ncbi:MAG: metalloregulator ArsR/SmtB family transcription factor [Acidimicrobiia bacterium]